MARTLDEVVTAVATELMAVNAATSAAVSQRVLADLVDHFGVDVSFLRHNDHDIHATRLIAEWPVRPVIPDPDPLGLVYFADADPVFAASRAREGNPSSSALNPRQTTTRRPSKKPATSPRRRWHVVPMLSGDVTTGVSGSSSSATGSGRPRSSTPSRRSHRCSRSCRPASSPRTSSRFLAEHDDLTGLNNRRALIAHLDQRLAPGQPGPVSTLFLDLDRLKAINDYLGHTAGDWFIRVFAKRLRGRRGRPQPDRPPRR